MGLTCIITSYFFDVINHCRTGIKLKIITDVQKSLHHVTLDCIDPTIPVLHITE